MLIAVMMSVLLVSREIDSRTVYYILAKPVRRWQFLLGKYAGLLATVLVNLVLMTVILVLFVWLYGGGFDPRLVLATGMIGVEMAVLVAFADAVFGSDQTHPRLGLHPRGLRGRACFAGSLAAHPASSRVSRTNHGHGLVLRGAQSRTLQLQDRGGPPAPDSGRRRRLGAGLRARFSPGSCWCSPVSVSKGKTSSEARCSPRCS